MAFMLITQRVGFQDLWFVDFSNPSPKDFVNDDKDVLLCPTQVVSTVCS